MLQRKQAIVVGGGPAGLMAAEQLVLAGCEVDIYDAMPSVGRKFLRAGVGGLNLTHAESFADFCSRYSQPDIVRHWLGEFDQLALREWAAGLGIATFTGSSGRVFPEQMKASPLLREWLRRLREAGVQIHTRHRWLGWETGGRKEDGQETPHDAIVHRFETPAGHLHVEADVTVLALGGGSWARLGSNGHWTKELTAKGLDCATLKPSNCGFDYTWSAHMRERFAGAPLKDVRLNLQSPILSFEQKGEALISRHGIQGSLVYQASRWIRDEIEKEGEVTIYWDLIPGKSRESVFDALSLPRNKESLSNMLRKRLGISGVKIALLHELAKEAIDSNEALANALKNLPQRLHKARPLDEAISTAGGVRFSAMTSGLMLKNFPGIFCAGEMLDWEAPTGGYLLHASFASGVVAGRDAARFYSRTWK